MPARAGSISAATHIRVHLRRSPERSSQSTIRDAADLERAVSRSRAPCTGRHGARWWISGTAQPCCARAGKACFARYRISRAQHCSCRLGGADISCRTSGVLRGTLRRMPAGDSDREMARRSATDCRGIAARTRRAATRSPRARAAGTPSTGFPRRLGLLQCLLRAEGADGAVCRGADCARDAGCEPNAARRL